MAGPASFIIKYAEFPDSFVINLDTHAPTIQWLSTPAATAGQLYTAQIKIIDPHEGQLVEAFLVLSDDDEVELMPSPVGGGVYSLSASVPNVVFDEPFIEVTVIDAVDNEATYTHVLSDVVIPPPPIPHAPGTIYPRRRRHRKTIKVHATVALIRYKVVRVPAWVELHRIKRFVFASEVSLQRHATVYLSAEREPAYRLMAMVSEDEELLLLLED